MPSLDTSLIELNAASPNDPDKAADLIYQTDPHIFDWLHCHKLDLVKRHLSAQWLAGAGIFSHIHCRAAYSGKSIVGICLGFTAEEQERHVSAYVECAKKVMSPEEFKQSFAWWAEIGSFSLPEVPDDAFYLQNLSVTEEFRGKGIGQRLLEDCINQSTKKGHKRVHLDVVAENPAVSLYRRMGMRTIVETQIRLPDETVFPLHLRMEKIL